MDARTAWTCIGGSESHRREGPSQVFARAWQETTFYTERERAALASTEAVTLVHASHVPDDLYEAVKKQFGDQEIADLTGAIAAINAWNRLAIAARAEPGTYVPVAPAQKKVHSAEVANESSPSGR